MPIQTAQQAISNEMGPKTSPFGFRNRIQNGEIQVNQRAIANTTNVASVYHANTSIDRWMAYHYNVGGSFNPNLSIKQTADHPIKGTYGYCLEIQCNTTGTTANGVDFFTMTQSVEAQNISDIFSGANAQPMTLSFWVKSNKTGTYCVQLRDNGTGTGGYVFVAEYSIVQSGTWEKKTISIPKPTYSAMPTNNGTGLTVHFHYASGQTPTYNGNIANAINAWYNYGSTGLATTNQTNLFTANGNYHRLTDVQLEAGTVATPFERRPFHVELQACQRYFQYVRFYHEYAQGAVGNLAGPIVPFPVAFRSAPSYTLITTAGTNTSINGPVNVSTGAYYYAALLGYASSTTGYGYRDATYAVSSEI